MTFRCLVEKLLRNKPKELENMVKQKVEQVLSITQKEFLSDETVALIILQQEAELERVNNESI